MKDIYTNKSKSTVKVFSNLKSNRNKEIVTLIQKNQMEASGTKNNRGLHYLTGTVNKAHLQNSILFGGSHIGA